MNNRTHSTGACGGRREPANGSLLRAITDVIGNWQQTGTQEIATCHEPKYSALLVRLANGVLVTVSDDPQASLPRYIILRVTEGFPTPLSFESGSEDGIGFSANLDLQQTIALLGEYARLPLPQTAQQEPARD